MSATARLVVFSNPVEGREDEFNDWYTNTHSPDVLKTGVAVGFTRYRCSGVELAPGIPEPSRYAVIYEVTAQTVEDVEKAVQILKESVEAGQSDVSPSLDLGSISAAWLLPITDHVSNET